MEPTRPPNVPPAVNSDTPSFRIAEAEDLTLKVNTLKRSIDHDMVIPPKIAKNKDTSPDNLSEMDWRVERRIAELQKQPYSMTLEISEAIVRAALQEQQMNKQLIDGLKPVRQLENIIENLKRHEENVEKLRKAREQEM